KRPEQVIDELDRLAAGGAVSVYFVDDNFIGSPTAAETLLPHLVAWQRRQHYRVRLSCEATLNLARHPRLLALMREANFATVFCGIETPEPEALRLMRKTQNLRVPIVEAVETMNRHGIEVASGIIMGLDSDTPATPDTIVAFAEMSQIPILAVNLLYALPRTALHHRLMRARRLVTEGARDSTIEFLEPYESVVERWRQVIAEIYQPDKLFARYATQTRRTYPNRVVPPDRWKHTTWAQMRRAAGIFRRLVWRVG